MIRLAHLSDSHFDERGRIEDCVAVHQAFLDQARAAGVDLILHTGDLFERRSTPLERNLAAAFLRSAAEIAPVALVQGNHDAPGDLDIFRLLHSKNSIEVFSRPTLGVEPAWRLGRLAVFALPWFDRANVAALVSAEVSQEQLRTQTIDAATQLLDLLRIAIREARDAGAIPILGAHVQVAGSETSTGQTLIGSTVELSPAVLADLGCAYVGLGHIHKHQAWHDGRVTYAGSPLRQNFGEPEEKGWILVEIDQERRTGQSRFMPLPARGIVLLEVDYTKGQKLTRELLNETVHGGDLVRLRYRIAAEELHLVNEERLAEEIRRYGAHEVKLEAVVVAETRARCEEIVSATSTWDKVLAYLQAKQIQLGDAQLERLRDKLASIEQTQAEVTDAAA